MTALSDRRGENDAAIAAYAAAELADDHRRKWPTFAAAEQCMNTEYLNGEFAESDRIRAAINKIIRDRKARQSAARHAPQMEAAE